MQKFKRWIAGLIAISIGILLLLYIAGIVGKKSPAQQRQEGKTTMASLMMLNHDEAFKRLKKQWLSAGLQAEDKHVRNEKIQRLMLLNKKVISSYKKELHNLIKLGLGEKSPEVNFIREQLYQGVLDNALLERERERLGAGLCRAERQKITELIAINKECVNCCKQEIATYQSMGLHEQDPRLKDAHERLAQAVAEIRQLEPVID